jgi:acyl-CoA hydrolase
MFDPKSSKKSRLKKTPRESSFVTRKVVMPEMLNPNGTLFGGVVMSWIDEVAFMSARRHSGRSFVVTASIDNITFLRPLRNGDHVLLTSQVNYAGRTSMEIGVKVEREDPFSEKREQTTSAYLTFVALDDKAKPCLVPELTIETEEDQRRFEEALVRMKVRERVKAYLKRKVALGQTRDAKETSKRRELFAQMASNVKDAWARYQRLAKLPKLRLPPKDLKKLLRREQQ